jgi:hypothetical protein
MDRGRAGVFAVTVGEVVAGVSMGFSVIVAEDDAENARTGWLGVTPGVGGASIRACLASLCL